jgi:hypothetical protein
MEIRSLLTREYDKLKKKNPTSSLSICPSESNKDDGNLPSLHRESICWNKSLIFTLRLVISDVARCNSFSGFNFSRLESYTCQRKKDKLSSGEKIATQCVKKSLRSNHFKGQVKLDFILKQKGFLLFLIIIPSKNNSLVHQISLLDKDIEIFCHIHDIISNWSF